MSSDTPCSASSPKPMGSKPFTGHTGRPPALADPSPDERRLLGEFHYQPNTATVHTDESVMPRAHLAWSSWNYEINRGPDGRAATATHY